MKKLLIFLGALAAYGQTVSLSDTLTNAVGGGSFTGRITVTLNAPGNAQPLYYSTTSLTGWQAVYCLGVTGSDCTTTTAAGVFSATLYANSTITPAGTSYSARFTPAKGSPWTEAWVITPSATTLRQARATTVPTPTTTFQASQIVPGTNGQVLTTTAGATAWGSVPACATCVVTSGSYADPAWITSLAGSKVSGAVASATTATTATSATTATALAANGTNCAAGTFPLGVDASGAAESCTALPTTISGTANQITASASTGAVTISIPDNPTLPGTTTGTFSGNVITVTINATLSPYFASGSSTTTTTVGTTAAGTAVTVTNCATFSAGHGVYIAGAGTAGSNYIGTVVSCAAGAMVVTPATVTAVSAGALVQHDDSAAIQAAITALASSGGTIYLPAGFYRCNGPFQDTSNANAVLLMPSIPYVANPPVSPVRIDIIGPSLPTPGGTSGAVIQTNKASGNLIAGYAANTGFGTFTNVWLHLANLTFRSYTDPNIAMINAANLAGYSHRNILVDVGQPPLCGYVAGCTPTTPTHSNAVAITTPATNNNASIDLAGQTMVYGYYTHLVAGEHIVVQDFYGTYGINCINPVSSNHPLTFLRVACENFVTGWLYTSGTPTVFVGQYSSENTTTHISGGDALAGRIGYCFPDGETFTGVSKLKLESQCSNSSSKQLGSLTTGTPIIWFPGNFLARPDIRVKSQFTDTNAITIIPAASVTGYPFGGYTTEAQPSFTGKCASIRVPKVVTGSNVGVVQYFFVGKTASNWVGFRYSADGNLVWMKNDFSTIATVAYNATNHAYWRVCESGGTWTGYTSPDASTWTSPTGFNTTVAWSYTSGVKIIVAAGTNNYSSATPGYAQFDTFAIN